MDDSMRFTTNNLGFRGDSLIIPKPANEYRVFLVGGSTAECFYLDDSKSIDHVLQEELQQLTDSLTVKVYNAGRSADATPEHIAMLSHRIVYLQPDVIILFAGLNDFIKSVQGYDYLHLQKTDLHAGKHDWLFSFQLVRRFYNAFKSKTVREKREIIKLATNYKELVEIQNKVEVSSAIPKANSEPYRVNLNSITGICTMNAIPLVFMTNATTWNSQVDEQTKRYQWMRLCNGVNYSEQNMDNGLNAFNDIMRQTSTAHGIPLLDLAKTLPKSADYFYDDCHFNINGASIAGKQLADLMAKENLLH
jgi:lysophospholipase L1-like esterase